MLSPWAGEVNYITDWYQPAVLDGRELLTVPGTTYTSIIITPFYEQSLFYTYKTFFYLLKLDFPDV